MLAAAATGAPRWVRQLEPALHFQYWEDALWAFGAAVLAFVAGRVLAHLLHLLASRWARLTVSPVDDIVVKHLHDPVRWLVPLLCVAAALSWVELRPSVHTALRQLVIILIILNVGWLLFRVVRVLEEVVSARLLVDGIVKADARGNYTQLQSFRSIAGFLIGLVSIALALLSFAGVRQLGTSVLASAGVVGIVVGFAAQRSIASIFAGLVIAIAQPIRIGEVVVVEGHNGVVEEITLTYVVVRLGDLRRLVLPVNTFLEKPFENWSRVSTEMIGEVLLYLDYSLPVDAVRRELERVLEASPNWDRNTWSLQVVDATERTMVIRAQMSAVDSGTAWSLRCEVREKLLAFVQEHQRQSLPRQRNIAAS